MSQLSTTQRLHQWFFDSTGRTFSRAHKLLLLLGAGVAWAIVLLIGRLLGAPEIRGFAPSLLVNSPPLLGVAMVLLSAIFGVAACTALTGRIRADAGIFCTAAGLLALRLCSGPTRLTLMYGEGRGGLLAMAVELCAIAVALVLCFMGLRILVARGMLPDDAQRDGVRLPVEKLDQKMLCTVTCAVVMAVIMMILCQSDAPGQVIWSVLIASWLATLCAFRFAAVSPSVWYWSAPLVLGVAGYLWTAVYGSATAGIGVPGGLLSAMARPAPLDYASVGVIGAMIGYWTSRRHHRERAEREDDEPRGDEVTYSRG